MNYNEALAYTHSLLKFGIKPGLERVSRLLARLGNPQDRLEFIHVAGTNGKGSTCAMISSILREAIPDRIGLFISPYIVDFRERIQINGEYIPEEEFASIATEVKAVIEEDEESPTEFEFITIVAFLYFFKKRCNFVVLETGLGGRFDATNVIKTTLLSVITSIDYDHTNILGKSIEKITYEKCGIIKSDKYTITTPKQNPYALDLIARHCSRMHNPLLVPSDNYEIKSRSLDGTTFEVEGKEYTVNLLGDYQIENALTAIEVARIMNLDDKYIKSGLKKAVNPARFEVINTDPVIIVDGAHNIEGVIALRKSLENYFPGQKLLGVCGMLADKSYEDELYFLRDSFSSLILMTPDNPRALPATELKKVAEKHFEDITICENPNDLCKLIADKSNGIPTIVFGSLYLASQVRPILLNSTTK